MSSCQMGFFPRNSKNCYCYLSIKRHMFFLEDKHSESKPCVEPRILASLPRHSNYLRWSIVSEERAWNGSNYTRPWAALLQRCDTAIVRWTAMRAVVVTLFREQYFFSPALLSQACRRTRAARGINRVTGKWADRRLEGRKESEWVRERDSDKSGDKGGEGRGLVRLTFQRSRDLLQTGKAGWWITSSNKFSANTPSE